MIGYADVAPPSFARSIGHLTDATLAVGVERVAVEHPADVVGHDQPRESVARGGVDLPLGLAQLGRHVLKPGGAIQLLLIRYRNHAAASLAQLVVDQLEPAILEPGANERHVLVASRCLPEGHGEMRRGSATQRQSDAVDEVNVDAVGTLARRIPHATDPRE